MALSSHQYHVDLAIEFLLHVNLIVHVPDNTEWYTKFRDYIFPWVLTLHELLNLVVVFLLGKPRSDSDPKWSEGEDSSDDGEDSDLFMDED